MSAVSLQKMAYHAHKPATAASQRRAVHGVLLLDKPVGMTSNQALQAVKRIFNARKAGHSGSLDPLASGLLPVCFGEATKVSAFLLDADKEYSVRCRFGIRTTTADAEGEVMETRALPSLSGERIEQVFEQFRGVITQTPPMYSALKHQGQRLYDLAREGITVPRQPRTVTIHALALKEYSKDSIEFQVRCSKGTYVRTLVEDMAYALGSCGHVSALRRTRVGPYVDLHSLDALQEVMDYEALDSLLLPVDSALTDWPQVNLGDDALWYFLRGQAVLVPSAPTSGWLRTYGNGRFLGLAEVLPDGRVTPRRLMNIDRDSS